MGFLIKQNRVFKHQKFAITSLAAWILVWLSGTSYAQTVLSDEEMDQVYARGFFLDFDVSFGTVDDVMKTTSGGTFRKPGQLGVVNRSSSNVKMLTPSVPQKPATPTSPLQTVNIKEVATDSAQGSSSANPSSAQVIPATTATAIASSGGSSEAGSGSVIPAAFVQSIDAPVTSSVQPQTSPSATEVAPAVSTQTEVGSSATQLTPAVGTQQLSTVSAIPVSQPQSVDAVAPVIQQPVSPVAPTPVDNTNFSTDPALAGTIPAIKLDVVATQAQNGQTGLNLNSVTGDFSSMADAVSPPAVPAAPDMPQTPETPQLPISTVNLIPAMTPAPLASGSSNLVVVDDLAQQHLSALVNVNAAGSVVPVLLNIVININSTVENLSTNNSLNLQNFFNLLQGNSYNN